MFTRLHIPNWLTAFRVAVIPLIIAAIYLWPQCWTLPFTLFLLAGISDFLDGWLARKWEVKSSFGRMLDPIADKLLIAAILVVMIDTGQLSGWNILPVLIILLRELLVSGLREYMSDINITMHVTALAKWKTATQLVATGLLLLPPPVAGYGLWLLWLAGILTAITGYQYARDVLKNI